VFTEIKTTSDFDCACIKRENDKTSSLYFNQLQLSSKLLSIAASEVKLTSNIRNSAAMPRKSA
jgi:hypothetical protein